MIALLLLASLSSVNGIVEDRGKKLEFVYALWRHGDRSPSMTFPTDPIQENSWTFGEGGFGVLTPIGMDQHFKLGRIMRNRYVETGFLSHQYKSKEVKVFSSKIVRTQVSAVSNMIGMYGSPNGSLGGISYPNTPGWPTGFVPVPNQILEEASNALMNCPRSNEINQLIYRSKAFNTLKSNPKTQWVLSELTRLTGTTATLESLERFYEPMLGESIHFPSKLSEWCSKELFDGVMEIFRVIDDLKAGVGLEETVEGINLAFEVPLLHGGYFTEMMRDSMKKRIDGIKYFAVSSHDVEVSAFLSVFGIKEKLYRGRPNYTSSIVVELWTDENGEEFAKMFFRNGDTDSLKVVTPLIEGCNGEEYCPIDVIDMYITRFRPGNLFELCATPLQIEKRIVTRGDRYI